MKDYPRREIFERARLALVNKYILSCLFSVNSSCISIRVVAMNGTVVGIGDRSLSDSGLDRLASNGAGSIYGFMAPAAINQNVRNTADNVSPTTQHLIVDGSLRIPDRRITRPNIIFSCEEFFHSLQPCIFDTDLLFSSLHLTLFWARKRYVK